MLDQYPIYDPMVACRTLEGEAVIVHSRTRRMHVLDPVGTFIWESCARGDLTLRQVAEALGESYEVESVEAQRDVLSFVEELQGERLLILQDEPAG